MKNSSWPRALFASIALLAPPALAGIGEQPDRANHNVSIACLEAFETTYGTRYRVVRIIDDHGTGRRWLLVQQFDRLDAPALLVEIPNNHSCAGILHEDSEWRRPTAHQILPLPVIRPGDSVILSEDSPVSHTRLEAIALERAATDQTLTVRLKLGGHLLRAVATAPGRATLLVERNEVRR